MKLTSILLVAFTTFHAIEATDGPAKDETVFIIPAITKALKELGCWITGLPC